MDYYYSSRSSYSINKKNIPQIVIVVNKGQEENVSKNKTVSNTNLSYSEFTNPSHIFKDTKSEIDNLRRNLENILSLDDIVGVSKSFFQNSKYYLFDRIKQLFDLFDEEANKISITSLKSMLFFLILVNNFIKPTITLNENGTFQVTWKKDNFNLVTLRFKDDDFLDYVIFCPSKHVKKPIILNGNMNLFDFKDYLIKIGLYFQISERY
ncbi:Uncharacterized protein dnl_29830 [Desulfonema limicola]|uniref:Uncharacterized protein n=1 Tax=Desulfonema limicola TaxID=45656 RepID=A0A975B8K8_9BACT|nr:hypothetical protein [Desulfonema limicola]QTA80672.1 Uncharacterized protein dnl_29830 [Desulfonema limicola]